MPKLHLRQPGFKHTACVPLTENNEIIKTVKETPNPKYANLRQCFITFVLKTLLLLVQINLLIQLLQVKLSRTSVLWTYLYN